MFKERRIGKDVSVGSSNYLSQSFVNGAVKITYTVLSYFRWVLPTMGVFKGWEGGHVMLRLYDPSPESEIVMDHQLLWEDEATSLQKAPCEPCKV